MKAKTDDLKKILRPLIEQIVEEKLKKMLLEEKGVLSNLITEISAGMSRQIPAPVSFDNSAPIRPMNFVREQTTRMTPQINPERQQKNNLKKKILEEVSKGAYSGVNVFEGVKALHEEEQEASAGVDLSSLIKIGALKG